MKTRFPIFITAFVGIFMILKYFLVPIDSEAATTFSKYATAIADELVQWCVIVLAFALVLGVLRNALTLLGVDAYWQQVTEGAIIIGAVVIDMRKNAKKK